MLIQKIILKQQSKVLKEEIKFLSTEEVKSILNKPKQNTRKGLKELVILGILYDTGIKVNELINLSLDDVRLGEVSTIKVLDKGNKYRTIPISDNLKLYYQNILQNLILYQEYFLKVIKTKSIQVMELDISFQSIHKK